MSSLDMCYCLLAQYSGSTLLLPSIAVPSDLDDVSMMKESIQHCRCCAELPPKACFQPPGFSSRPRSPGRMPNSEAIISASSRARATKTLVSSLAGIAHEAIVCVTSGDVAKWRHTGSAGTGFSILGPFVLNDPNSTRVTGSIPTSWQGRLPVNASIKAPRSRPLFPPAG